MTKLLHARDDEQAEEQWPLIPWRTWHYPGCMFCGHENHRTKDCPNRPKRDVIVASH